MTEVIHHDQVKIADHGILGAGYRGATSGIVLVVTLLAFENMAVGTVMPVVADDLNGLPLYAWGFSATLIMSLLSTVLAGGWVDRAGPSRPFMAGLGTFLAGLVVAGAASSMEVFVAGRAVQGLGTGISLVAMYVVIARVYPESLRSRVFAALAAAWVLPSLIGPALGGFVAEHIGWRWVFLGLIPLVIPPALALVPALRGIGEPETAPANGGGRVPAAGAVAAGAALLLYGLDGAGWTTTAAAVAGLAGLVFGLPRLLPPGTLRLRRGLPSVIAVRGLLAGAFTGAEVFVPLALVRLHGFSAGTAGLVLTAGALGWSAASQIQGRSERPREFYVLIGAFCVITGIAAATFCLRFSGWATVLPWIVAGAGMGFAIGSLSVLLLRLSPADEQGVNSSALQVADTLGSSLVVGVAGALVAAFGAARLGTGLAVAGVLCAVIAAFGVFAAFRLEVET